MARRRLHPERRKCAKRGIFDLRPVRSNSQTPAASSPWRCGTSTDRCTRWWRDRTRQACATTPPRCRPWRETPPLRSVATVRQATRARDGPPMSRAVRARAARPRAAHINHLPGSARQFDTAFSDLPATAAAPGDSESLPIRPLEQRATAPDTACAPHDDRSIVAARSERFLLLTRQPSTRVRR